jgi:WD40 repeat protein
MRTRLLFFIAAAPLALSTPMLCQNLPDVVWAQPGDFNPLGCGCPFTSFAFSHDSKRMASLGFPNRSVMIWRVKDGALMKSFDWELTDFPACVAFSPEGELLAAGGEGGIVLGRLSDRTLPLLWPAGGERVTCLAFSPSGQLLASAGGRLRLWDVKNRTLLDTLPDDYLAVGCIAFSPDGALLASGSYDATVKIWRVADRGLLRTLPGESYRWINSVAFSPDGQTLAAATAGCTCFVPDVGPIPPSVKLWRVNDGTTLWTNTSYNYSINAVAFAPGGDTLLTSSSQPPLRILRVQDGAQLMDLEDTWQPGQDQAEAHFVAYSPSGRYYAYDFGYGYVVVARRE